MTILDYEHWSGSCPCFFILDKLEFFLKNVHIRSLHGLSRIMHIPCLNYVKSGLRSMFSSSSFVAQKIEELAVAKIYCNKLVQYTKHLPQSSIYIGSSGLGLV